MFKTLWNNWKSFAQKIGHIQSTILLTIVYYILFLPYSLIKIHHTDNKHSTWKKHNPLPQTIETLKEQY